MNLPSDDLEVLFAAWFAGEAGREEQVRLEALLRADPAARERFARWCAVDMAIRQRLRVDDLEPAPAAPSAEALPGAIPTRTRRSGVRQRRRVGVRRLGPVTLWPLAALAAAALLILGLLLGRGVSTNPSPPTVASQEPSPAAMNASSLAEVRSLSGRLELGGLSAAVGATVAAEVRIDVSEGKAVLRLRRDGSELDLAAGSRISLADAATIRLTAGRIGCRITPQGAGQVRVQAPQALVEVVGTAFSVTATGATTVIAVDHGIVRVAPHAGGERQLQAGESATVDGDGFVDRAVERRPGILGFVLIDTTSNLPLGDPVPPGGTLTVPAGLVDHFSVRIDCDPAVQAIRVERGLGGQRVEKLLPFSLFSDDDGTFRSADLRSGTHRIAVRAFVDGGAVTARGADAELVLVVP